MKDLVDKDISDSDLLRVVEEAEFGLMSGLSRGLSFTFVGCLDDRS
jgi:hypothetical protein